ncbi:MAG: hypothetical protein PT977_06090, partial [Acidobacteriota bacterium]|nr:hypothetical protein [Acidobacteriota bacterium]
DALEAVPVSYVTVRPRRMNDEQRVTAEKLVAAGLDSHRLLRVRHFLPDDDLYAVVKTEPRVRALENGPAEGNKEASTGTESADLTGSIDRPSAEAVVTGDLVVSGWARIPGHDLGVSVLIDNAPRVPLRAARVPRPDVEAAVPGLGDCGTAGYENVFAFQPGDEGEHELSVVLSGPDDRVRHYPWRKFTWKKHPGSRDLP